VEFAREIQRIAKWNDLGNADMEKWQMRVDVNISIKPTEESPLGTRVELKNINSFWAMKRAIEGEYQRQKTLLESWATIQQETRRREDGKSNSFAMRSKEDAVDYRYFPEPDLPPLVLEEFLK
jgi:aspartyl-tRNA(Asn)/glutamyl-tRNA(Gln) amidotransferase subunit B